MIVNEQGRKYEFSREFLLDMYSNTGILINPETGRTLPRELKVDLLTEGANLSEVSLEDHSIEVVPETRIGDALALLLEGTSYRGNILHGDKSAFSDLTSPVGDGLSLKKSEDVISFNDLSTFSAFCMYGGYYDLYEDYEKELEDRFEDTTGALDLLTQFIEEDNYQSLEDYIYIYGVINTAIYEDLKELLRRELLRRFQIDDKISTLREMNPDFHL